MIAVFIGIATKTSLSSEVWGGHSSGGTHLAWLQRVPKDVSHKIAIPRVLDCLVSAEISD